MTLKGKKIFWVIALLVVVADLASKSWAFDLLGVDAKELSEGPWVRTPDHSVVGETFKIVAVLNKGMMWGAFSNYHGALRIFRFFAVAVIFYLLLDLHPKQRWGVIALGGILGGALGNIYDSFTFHGVRDFLHFDFDFRPFDPWPSFNIADSAICVGVAILAISILFGGLASKSKSASESPQAKGPG